MIINDECLFIVHKKEDLRRLFDRLLDTNSTDYRLILAALVKCYDARSPADQDRLVSDSTAT